LQELTNWTVEDWENVACLISVETFRWQSQNLAFKQNENMDPSCLVTTMQAGGGGGVMVWWMFSWHTLGP